MKDPDIRSGFVKVLAKSKHKEESENNIFNTKTNDGVGAQTNDGVGALTHNFETVLYEDSLVMHSTTVDEVVIQEEEKSVAEVVHDEFANEEHVKDDLGGVIEPTYGQYQSDDVGDDSNALVQNHVEDLVINDSQLENRIWPTTLGLSPQV